MFRHAPQNETFFIMYYSLKTHTSPKTDWRRRVSEAKIYHTYYVVRLLRNM